MTARHIYIVMILLLVFQISCKEKETEEQEAIKTAINNMNIDLTDYKWIVVLPGLGCHGCIQEGEVFIQEFIDHKNILFVLTKIESYKILQNKIGIKLNKQTNTYIDKDNMFYIPTDNTIYPCIIELEKGNLKSYGFQSPKNSQAFAKLKEQIKNSAKINKLNISEL